VAGDLAGGYTVVLDEVAAPWRYLEVASLTANRALADGYYGFTLGQGGLPGDWLTYWAAKGVVSGTTGWQGVMWHLPRQHHELLLHRPCGQWPHAIR
jgi:hypothetical protein